MGRLLKLTAATCIWNLASGQIGVTDCALPCIADVNGTSCSQAQWPCLCPSSIYIDRLNACVYRACVDPESQQATFGAIASICNVFGFPLSAGPEVNAASTTDLLGTVSILGVPTPSTIAVVSGTATSGPTTGVLTGTSTPPGTSRTFPNATLTTSSDGVRTGSNATILATSGMAEISGSTTSSFMSSAAATETTSLGGASLVKFDRYAALGGALVAGFMVEYI